MSQEQKAVAELGEAELDLSELGFNPLSAQSGGLYSYRVDTTVEPSVYTEDLP